MEQPTIIIDETVDESEEQEAEEGSGVYYEGSALFEDQN